ncbi:uncharacterized protein LOC143909765 [Arctopsyche grandis]|uniref:uncharacterized protein LOC143909765 n=1 Tax=Arctopsyche grandis TaxID=121162 RepID=UPI00406D9EC0
MWRASSYTRTPVEERSLLCTSPGGDGAQRSTAILLKNRREVEWSITPSPEFQPNFPCIPHAVSGETSAVRPTRKLLSRRRLAVRNLPDYIHLYNYPKVSPRFQLT